MKHKTLTILLALLMSMAAFEASAYDYIEGVEIDGIYYDLVIDYYDDYHTFGNYATVSYSIDDEGHRANYYSGDIIIPDEVTFNGLTFKVDGIGYKAFDNCTNLTSISLPSSMNYIDDRAFRNCSGLTSISIPNSVTYIGSYAFSGCSSLTTVTIPNSVTHINLCLFEGCTSLKCIYIPAECTICIYDEDYYYTGNTDGISSPFKGCSALSYFIIGGPIRIISFRNERNTAYWITRDCNNLRSIFCLGDDCGDLNFGYPYYLKDFFTWAGDNTFTYNGKTPSLTYTCNLPLGFQPTMKPGTTLEKGAGKYSTNIPFTFTNADISFDVEMPCTYTIAPAELKAKAENASRKYGEQNPQFNVRYSGFVNGEGESEISTFPTCTTTATTTSDVGSYPINVSGGSARNYTFTYEGAQLTVTKAPLTLKAKDKDMVYGDKVPTLEMDYDGLKNNESKPKWVYEPQLTTSATSASKVGTYAISISQGEAVNYDLSYKSGTLTVGKAPLTLTANNKRLTYGEGMPNLDYTMTGLKNGESKPEWKREPQIKTTATASSKAGNYPISSGEATNYELSYENGQLTIDKAQLTVSTKNYTRAYGEANPEFELAYQGFVKGENKSVLFAQPKATTQADKNSDVGTYDITISGGAADNYDFKYVSGKLTIEKAYQTLTWDQELSNMELYQQVELTATASSGLDISYYSSDASVCEIQKVGSRRYINCVGEGETAIYAIQEGNKNYWESSKVYKRIKVVDMTGVGDVLTEDKGANIYDTNGIKRSTLRKGLNIVRTNDGTVKKVMIK